MVKIDPLYFLLLIELALILFVLAIFLFIRNRKHKDLYQKTLRKLNDLKSEISVETLDRPASSESALAENLPENLMEQEQQPLQDSGVAEFIESGQPEESEGGAMPGQLRRLQRMVNSQKSTILELMCYKDVFDGARKRLALLQEENNGLQDKIKDLIKGGAESEGFAEVVSSLEESNREVEKFITIINREDERLTDKFQSWEEEFKRIEEDMEKGPDAAAIDDSKYAEILQEKEMLTARSKEFQEKLEEKDKNLEAMQAQYEDLEKEYMVLYRQQQAQQPQDQ
ncbi:MAG: hypothetical protein ACLQF0_03980 [Dissulfurispiraceae bacterium]